MSSVNLAEMFDSLPENLQHNIRLQATLMEMKEDRFCNHSDERKMLIMSITRLWAALVVYMNWGFREYMCTHILNNDQSVIHSGYHTDFSIDPFLMALQNNLSYGELFAIQYPLVSLQKMVKLLEEYEPGESSVYFIHSLDIDYHAHHQNACFRQYLYMISHRIIPKISTFNCFLKWRARKPWKGETSPWENAYIPGPVFDMTELYQICLSSDKQI
jgi:hypothetical protein